MSPSPRTRAALLFFALFACSGEPQPSAESPSVSEATPKRSPTRVSGTVTHGDHTMKVVGAVAVHDSNRRRLRVTFLPFMPTPEEVTMFQNDRGGLALLERDDSSIEGFPDRIPRSELTISWDEDEDVTRGRCHFYVNKLTTQYSSMNLNWTYGNRHALTIENGVEKGSPIVLNFSGQDTVGEQLMRWDLQLHGPLEPALSELR